MRYSRVHLCAKNYGMILQSYCTNKKGAIFYASQFIAISWAAAFNTDCRWLSWQDMKASRYRFTVIQHKGDDWNGRLSWSSNTAWCDRRDRRPWSTK